MAKPTLVPNANELLLREGPNHQHHHLGQSQLCVRYVGDARLLSVDLGTSTVTFQEGGITIRRDARIIELRHCAQRDAA